MISHNKSSWLLGLLHFLTFVQAEKSIKTTVIIITVSSAATPTAPHPPSYTSPEVFRDDVLTTSNGYRKAHNATQLLWNETLSKYARDWAEGCKWEHSHGPYGENLAFGYPEASAAIAGWGDEGQHYDFRKPTGFSEETGHFTQLVWRATRQVGCAAVDCGYSADEDDGRKNASGQYYRRAQGWYVVCEYLPPGNVLGGSKAMGGEKGFFKVNVQPSSTYSGPWTTTDDGTTETTTTASGAAGQNRVSQRLIGWLVVLAVMSLWYL